MLPSAIPPPAGPPRKGSRWRNHAAGATPTPIYHPSIYTYTCRGAYFVASNVPHSEGTCRGIRTRLELLSDMDANTREGAIKDFTYMTEYELDEDDAANSLNQKTKSILISPALIYKEDATERGGKAGTSLPHQTDRTSSSRRPVLETPASATARSSHSSSLPEEELIKHQQWSCYGSTEVELLVLKNELSGREHIAAVAPRNVGISIRKIHADEGSITSIGVGWLNIVVDAGPAFVEDDMDDNEQEYDDYDDERDAVPSGQALEPSNAALSDDRTSSYSSPRVPSSRTPIPRSDDLFPMPSPESLAKAKALLVRYVDFGGKVAEQMKSNALWLRETLQDDFPSRTVAAGQKIATNLPRTIDRTMAFAQKLWDRWSGGGGDDDRGSGRGAGGPDL